MELNFQNLSVLVVEDNSAVMELLSTILQSIGFKKIHKAANGQDAFVLYKQKLPDLIITDWEMDPIDGLTMSKMIRTHPDSPNRMIPIIILTGYSYHERVQQARDIGVTEFLVKPFAAEELINRIAYVINKPRDFVETDTFVGPDRRRRDIPALAKKERRKKRNFEVIGPDDDAYNK